MKKITFFISVLAAYIFFAACETHDNTKLPPETQTGANTFGCYIDGELFVQSNKRPNFYIPALSATYIPIDVSPSEKKGIYISCFDINGKEIYLFFTDTETNSNIIIDEVFYSGVVNFNVPNMYLTKLDTADIDGIISGRFAFNLTDSVNNRTIKFTDGRFDIKLYCPK
jgi:hypothetical protein